MLMKYGEYFYHTASKHKVDGIRESPNQYPTDILIQLPICFGHFPGTLDCSIKFQNELNSETKLLAFIPIRCIVCIGLCRRLDPYLIQVLRIFSRI